MRFRQICTRSKGGLPCRLLPLRSVATLIDVNVATCFRAPVLPPRRSGVSFPPDQVLSGRWQIAIGLLFAPAQPAAKYRSARRPC